MPCFSLGTYVYTWVSLYLKVSCHRSSCSRLVHLELYLNLLNFRLDLYTRDAKSGIRNYTKVGQATVGTVCQYHRTSIIEDRGRFESAFTGAHELGHK